MKELTLGLLLLGFALSIPAADKAEPAKKLTEHSQESKQQSAHRTAPRRADAMPASASFTASP